MKIVSTAVAAALAAGLLTAAVDAAEPTWQAWDSDHGHMVIRTDGDLLIGLTEGFRRFELHSTGQDTWRGIVTEPIRSTICPGDLKLADVVWGNLTLTFDATHEHFTGKSDLCGTGVDPDGSWLGALPTVK
jgi:hypothetical protein